MRYWSKRSRICIRNILLVRRIRRYRRRNNKGSRSSSLSSSRSSSQKILIGTQHTCQGAKLLKWWINRIKMQFWKRQGVTTVTFHLRMRYRAITMSVHHLVRRISRCTWPEFWRRKKIDSLVRFSKPTTHSAPCRHLHASSNPSISKWLACHRRSSHYQQLNNSGKSRRINYTCWERNTNRPNKCITSINHS